MNKTVGLRQSLDFGNLTLCELLNRAVELAPDHVAVIFPESGKSLTYREFDEQVNLWCRILRSHSIAFGDRVGIMLTNRIEYPIIWFGLARLGAIMVTVNSNFRSHDAGHIIKLSGCRLVVGAENTIGVLRSVASDLVPELVIVDADAVEEGNAQVDSITALVVPESTVNLQFTSGTSGSPKGCVLSHRYWLTMAHKNVIEVPGLNSKDVILTAQPFSYMDPQWSFVSSMAALATLVVLDRFHPSSFWKSVADYKVTFFYCLGVMPRLMLRSPVVPAEREHRVRVVCCSGIPTDLHFELESRFGVPWIETYGMTEIGNGASMHLKDAARFVGTGVIGRATSRRELRVLDKNGAAVERGIEGELAVRGVGLMDGYFDDVEATAQVFYNGWFRTGDRVVMDSDGFVKFCQREKDMIRRSGENISAVEVEQVIEQNVAVLISACVPVTDDLRGEEVKAFVVLQPGSPKNLVESELPEFCDALLAYFKVPRYWVVLDALPLTASSKVAKSDLMAPSFQQDHKVWDRMAGSWT